VVVLAVVCAAVAVAASLPVGIAAASHHRADAHGLLSLPPAAQGAVSAALGRDDPADQARAAAGGLSLRNAGQRLVARFGDSGTVQVSSGDARLGLSLVGYGYGGALQPVGAASPHAEANRVVYTRGGLSEWYANGPLGLEQGFTLAAPPDRHRIGSLTISLALSGNTRARMTRGTDAVTFVGPHGTTLVYRGLVATDASGRELPAQLKLIRSRLLIRIDVTGALYPLRIDPFVQQAELTPSDGGAGDVFGNAIAISGNTLVVGSGFGSAVDANAYQGVVYVFTEGAGGWADATQTAELTASNGAADDGLGESVAISGDTIVAGAPDATVNGNQYEGAAYVFVKPANGWTNATQTAELTASDGVSGEAFGYAAAISGNTLVVGGPYAYPYGDQYSAGAAYVFVKPAGGWANSTETAELTVGGRCCTVGGYALAVAMSANTIVVGAPDTTVDGAFTEGEVFVYQEPATGWATTGTPTAGLTASDAYTFTFVGDAVAISGDTIAAGAFGSDLGPDGVFGDGYGDNIEQGAVYVWVEPPEGGWADATQTAKLYASDGIGDDALGVSLAMTGNTIVASNNPSTGSDSAAYVFVEPQTGWTNGTETQKLVGSDSQPGDGFGLGLATTGTTIFATAPDANSNEGKAYIFTAALAQAVTFTSAPPARPVAGDTYVVTATGGASGNPVMFTIDSSSTPGACSILGATVTFTGAGSCVIDANQAGNASYLAAPQVEQSMTVTVTAAGVGALTLRYVDGSAKYKSSGALAKALVNLASNLLSTVLGPVGPHLPPAVDTALINTYKLGVAALQAEGWLTPAQAATLDAAASEL